MKDFQSRPGRLAALPFEARFVYSGFIVFALLGLFSSLLLYDNSMGTSLAQTAQYYLGDGSDLAVPKSYRTLLETTHFHLFTISVVWLILVHLYLLCHGNPATKRFWAVTSFVAALGHIAAPWLVRYGGTGLSAWFAASGILLFVSFFWIAVRPLWEMWGSASR